MNGPTTIAIASANEARAPHFCVFMVMFTFLTSIGHMLGSYWTIPSPRPTLSLRAAIFAEQVVIRRLIAGRLRAESEQIREPPRIFGNARQRALAAGGGSITRRVEQVG